VLNHCLTIFKIHLNERPTDVILEVYAVIKDTLKLEVDILVWLEPHR
jgi:hypothetical protein